MISRSRKASARMVLSNAAAPVLPPPLTVTFGIVVPATTGTTVDRAKDATAAGSTVKSLVLPEANVTLSLTVMLRRLSALKPLAPDRVAVPVLGMGVKAPSRATQGLPGPIQPLGESFRSLVTLAVEKS